MILVISSGQDLNRIQKSLSFKLKSIQMYDKKDKI